MHQYSDGRIFVKIEGTRRRQKVRIKWIRGTCQSICSNGRAKIEGSHRGYYEVIPIIVLVLPSAIHAFVRRRQKTLISPRALPFRCMQADHHRPVLSVTPNYPCPDCHSSHSIPRHLRPRSPLPREIHSFLNHFRPTS
jgi:hypothetical protein